MWKTLAALRTPAHRRPKHIYLMPHSSNLDLPSLALLQDTAPLRDVKLSYWEVRTGLSVACHWWHAHRHKLGIGGFIFAAFALKESQYQQE